MLLIATRNNDILYKVVLTFLSKSHIIELLVNVIDMNLLLIITRERDANESIIFKASFGSRCE